MALVLQLAESFRRFSVTCHPKAPLYADLAEFIADEPDILHLMDEVPRTQRIPVLLFAAMHNLLLDDHASPLANHYPNICATRPKSSPRQLFKDYALTHASELRATMSSRTTQTNEVGRCAQFLPPMVILNEEVGPLAHIDVGTSAGLNLLLPHYGYDFHQGRRIGAESSLMIESSTRGPIPELLHVPDIAWSIGIDPSPIDVHNDIEVRWLEACVWPDQADRFQRLVRAIDIARHSILQIVTGDAVSGIANLVNQALTCGHPTITTSWVMSYLSHDDRLNFVAELDRIGSQSDLSWIIAESPSQTIGLPVNAPTDEDATVLSIVNWRRGERSSQRLARTHPHGYWIHWGE